MLKTRIITAAIMLAVFLSALFWLPLIAWALFVGVFLILAAGEWARMVGYSQQGKIIYILLTALLLGGLLTSFVLTHRFPNLSTEYECGIYLLAGIFWILVVPFWLAYKWSLRHSRFISAFVGWIMLIPCWIALIAFQSKGPGAVLAIMAIAWIADIFAYFTGKRFGKHKLAPMISPGKTWEGVIGAFIGVIIYALIYASITKMWGLPLTEWIFYSLIVFALISVTILGDLFKSVAKRQAGLKDSGTLFPGHGGIIDRIDSLMSLLPVSALLLTANNLNII